MGKKKGKEEGKIGRNNNGGKKNDKNLYETSVDLGIPF